MKKWKQISACCLAAVLAAAAPTGTAWAGSPEFARSAEEWAKLRDNVMEMCIRDSFRPFSTVKNKWE